MTTSGEAYRGPQFSAPPPFGMASAPTGPTDEQLRLLPPPGWPDPPVTRAPVPAPEQRPAVVGLAATLAVTASLLWVCGLSLGWVLAVAGSDALDQGGSDGFAFHLLDRFRLRMLDGLWVPLYAFPLGSLVSGFLLLARRSWPRVAHTVVAGLALVWSAWWLQDALLAWSTVAVYIAVAVGVLWTPAANRWYARR